MNRTAIAPLLSHLEGRVIRSGDPEYESVRRVYNGMIDKHPELIVRCQNVTDVVAAISFAQDNGLPLAIRGGGHNGAGLGCCDDGLVIDLSGMRDIDIDPATAIVRVAGGCTQGEVDQATHALGRAVPAGIISTTGIAGLTLGGGHGYLTRKYGLTIDNLIAADMVLADGRRVRVDPEHEPDLFWAIRGGGGNFGVVTTFHFRACSVNTVVAGPMLWELADAQELMQWYREFMPAAPEDLYGFLMFMNVPPGDPFPEALHGKTMCGVMWCYTGELDTADIAFAAVQQFRPPTFAHLGPMPFPALQQMFDPLLPPGLQWYWKGDFVYDLSDAAITQHLQYGSQLPSALSTMHLYPIDGAAHRVAKHETAFSFRDANWSMVIAGIDPDPANAEKITQWAKAYWNALRPYCAGGAYVNFMMEEGQERVQATYRDNYDRLVAIKTQYDPDNLFHINQNIKPRH
uniref:FAD linked oxidase domain protein n=1 Tax=Cyanothece sp. (strain PCC 7425 / ATCC 29141) TaxID=395961 RepID=B8HSC5_CYAP4